MRPLDGQHYCALRLQRLLVTAAGNELSEVDVIAFKVEAKQLQFGTQVSVLQMVIDAGELCGRIRRRNTACCWYENELTWYGCVCENVRCKSGVVRALPLALSVGYRMLVA